MKRLTLEAEQWLYRLLLCGAEGLPHSEFRRIDTHEDETNFRPNAYEEIHGLVRIFHPESSYESHWYINQAGIEYLKKVQQDESNT